MAWHRSSEMSMRLEETRGVGPVLAMMARGERYKEPVALTA
jgi:hypothetical protein